MIRAVLDTSALFSTRLRRQLQEADMQDMCTDYSDSSGAMLSEFGEIHALSTTPQRWGTEFMLPRQRGHRTAP